MLYLKKSNPWIPPVVGGSIAIMLAVGPLYLDLRIDWKNPRVPFYKGEMDSANSLLSVIATSVTTLLALIFTIIVVAIQLASSQYSPRALATLLQDRPSRILSNIAIRANSPGVNDPVSTVQVLDQLHDLLKRLLKIKMGELMARDRTGKARL